MKNCYKCNDPLEGKRITEEHIVLNAIGGRLKSTELICKTCNGKFGEGPDKALARDLQPLSTMLGIKRERGDNKPLLMQDKSGKEFRVGEPGVNPQLQRPYIRIKELENGGKGVNIVAKDMEQLRSILQGQLKAGNLTQADVDKILEKASTQENEHRPTLHKTISISPEAFPSIIKSAVNYYVHITDDAATIKPVIPYITGEKEPTEILTIITPDTLPYPEASDGVTHMIHVEGSGQTGLLYCMMEYFGIYHYLVMLSDSYSGPDVNSTYCYDVLNDRQVKRDFSWPLDAEGFSQQKEEFQRNPGFEAVQARFNHFMSHWEAKESGAHIQRIIQEVFKNHPGETVLTPEILNELATRITDFLITPRL